MATKKTNPKVEEATNNAPITPEVTLEEDIRKETSRFHHEIVNATRKEKKELYRSEFVVTEFGDEEIETESTLLRADYLELVASSKQKRILEGTITSVRYAGEYRKSTVLAEVLFGSGLFDVVIPSYVLYDYDESKYVDPAQIQAIENNITRRIGSKVKFIVSKVIEKDKIAYANRLEAQSRIGHGNYIKNQIDGKPRVIEDTIVKSQVIYTTSKGIIVDALGCDIAIKKEELSYSYIGDARHEFKVGDYVNVRVTNITSRTVEKNGFNYRIINAKGSVKAAMKDRTKELYDRIKVNTVCAGIVTYVEESGVFVRLKANENGEGGIDCLCGHPKYGEIPHAGETKLVKITDKADEDNHIYGIFMY